MTEYAPYAWLITHDAIADKDEPVGTNCNARGVVGPCNADPELVARLHIARVASKNNAGTDVQFFKISDDDGEHYYTGVRTGEADERFSEYGFEPLDDFGTPNAGATEIAYWERDSQSWELL